MTRDIDAARSFLHSHLTPPLGLFMPKPEARSQGRRRSGRPGGSGGDRGGTGGWDKIITCTFTRTLDLLSFSAPFAESFAASSTTGSLDDAFSSHDRTMLTLTVLELHDGIRQTELQLADDAGRWRVIAIDFDPFMRADTFMAIRLGDTPAPRSYAAERRRPGGLLGPLNPRRWSRRTRWAAAILFLTFDTMVAATAWKWHDLNVLHAEMNERLIRTRAVEAYADLIQSDIFMELSLPERRDFVMKLIHAGLPEDAPLHDQLRNYYGAD